MLMPSRPMCACAATAAATSATPRRRSNVGWLGHAACATSPRLRGEVDLRAERQRSEASRVRGRFHGLRLVETPPHPDSFAPLRFARNPTSPRTRGEVEFVARPCAQRRIAYSVHLPMVTRPPAASTASLASAVLDTCSTVGFFASSTSPLTTLLSIDHWVRLGLKPSFTDHTQFLVSTSQAYSTASLGFWVASMMMGTTLSFSRKMV